MNRISVIVPCYNGEKDIGRCIDSVLNQTIKDIEIIIIDDGSTDNTGKIADQYAKEYNNISVIHKANEGLPQARKTGLLHASTPYVGFVDSDDWIEPHMYEVLLHAAEKHCADVVCGGLYYDSEKCVRPSVMRYEDGAIVDNEKALSLLHRRIGVYQYVNTKIYKRELLCKIEFPYGNFTGEDYVTMIQVIERATKIVLVKKPLYHYIQTPESMSRGGFKPAHRVSFMHYESKKAHLIELYPSLRRKICSYMNTEYLSFIACMCRNCTFDLEMIKQITRFTRKNILNYICTPYVAPRFKLSALCVAVDCRIFVALFRIVS